MPSKTLSLSPNLIQSLINEILKYGWVQKCLKSKPANPNLNKKGTIVTSILLFGRICLCTREKFTTHLDLEESDKESDWHTNIEKAAN